jgi:hypothetical protein
VNPEDPRELEGKELHFWVTYPGNKRRGAKKKANRRHKDRRLWAVLIIESLKSTEAFALEVTLRRIFKSGENMIRVWVKNDPQDQSEDATVFRILSPPPEELTMLEQELVQKAAKRVYDAIAETWPAQPSSV